LGDPHTQSVILWLMRYVPLLDYFIHAFIGEALVTIPELTITERLVPDLPPVDVLVDFERLISGSLNLIGSRSVDSRSAHGVNSFFPR